MADRDADWSRVTAQADDSPRDMGAEAPQAPALSGVLTALKQAPLGVAIFDRAMRYLPASAQFLTDQGLPGDMPLVGRLHYDVFVPSLYMFASSKIRTDLKRDKEPAGLHPAVLAYIRTNGLYSSADEPK